MKVNPSSQNLSIRGFGLLFDSLEKAVESTGLLCIVTSIYGFPPVSTPDAELLIWAPCLVRHHSMQTSTTPIHEMHSGL